MALVDLVQLLGLPKLPMKKSVDVLWLSVATQDRVFLYYASNSSIKHSKSDSKDRSQEIL
jgi:hypothetical protein